MKILITGGSGYLGSKLARFLSEKHELTVLIRSTSSRDRLVGISANVVSCDSYSEINDLFRSVKPDVVINTIAIYGREGEKLDSLVDANISYPSMLLSVAVEHEVKTFIHTGTSLSDQVSLYALTKNTFVKVAKMHDNRVTQFIDIALEHFYGPSDDGHKFATWVLEKCISNDGLQLSSGVQQRDFIFIDDVLSAYETILLNRSNIGHIETISVGSGSVISVRHLVETIHKHTKSNSTLEFGVVPMRESELMYSCADIQKLSELGWNINYTLKQGLNMMIGDLKR